MHSEERIGPSSPVSICTSVSMEIGSASISLRTISQAGKPELRLLVIRASRIVFPAWIISRSWRLSRIEEISPRSLTVILYTLFSIVRLSTFIGEVSELWPGRMSYTA